MPAPVRTQERTSGGAGAPCFPKERLFREYLRLIPAGEPLSKPTSALLLPPSFYQLLSLFFVLCFPPDTPPPMLLVVFEAECLSLGLDD